MVCGRCGESYAVYGIALFCVACGQLSPAECFSEILRVHGRIVAHLDTLPANTRADLEADGVFTRIHEDTVKDTFSALENLLGQVFLSRVANAGEIIRRRGNIFQRLDDASALYQAHLGVSLSSLDRKTWGMLLEGAALRHLLTHTNGIVDERYLRAVASSRFQQGQRVHVSQGDADAVLESAMRLADLLLAELS
jgi:hypothetical protein